MTIETVDTSPSSNQTTPPSEVVADTDTSSAETHFGFKTVREADKAKMVHDVFAQVAERYDLMNDLMSGGLHRLWKQVMLDWLNPPRSDKPYHLIDVAGGTGDIAFRCLDRAGSGTQVTLCDINEHMLQVGRERSEKHGYSDRVEIACGDAMKLPFPDQSFDAYTIAFGIRNVTRVDEAIAEAYRVLKPGGHFMVLEFSHVVLPVIDTLYERYSFAVIPQMGKFVTGDADPYQYLIESIRQFPQQERFKQMIQAEGFERVSYRNLTGGVAAIHSGWRI